MSRDSTFSYKGKAAKTSQVSEELGVQYVLEGSVQMAGDRVRVTAQLIDALKGHHLWSERYDRSLKDLFDLQDEITMKILTELRVTITGERTRIKETDNLQAYLKVLEGIGYFRTRHQRSECRGQTAFPGSHRPGPELGNVLCRSSQ